jgi:DegV family protein with EDD domain
MAVAVLTDSAAALPKQTAIDAGVTIVPMWLTIGGTPVHDGDLALDEVMARVDEGVTTSGPTPGEFVTHLEEVGADDGAVIITIASTMSGTAQAAGVARQMFGPERVRVVDSRTAAGAEGLVVTAAARAAATGADLDAVAAAALRVVDRVHLVATVADLERLAKSGRVPEAAAWAGRWLGLNPLFEFRDGGAHALLPARSQAGALDRIFDRFVGSRTTGGCRVAALHALSEEPAHQLVGRVRETVDPAECWIGAFSPVMVAHTGPRLVGLAWWWDDEA